MKFKLKDPSKYDKSVAIRIMLKGETYEDYKDASDKEILEAFMTYYDIKRKDFTLDLVRY